MRLWSLHPRYLDAAGLVALWREALLAQAVLRGRTAGYRHHPQLDRFRGHAAPLSALNAYLQGVHAEACTRGYAFDAGKLGRLGRRPVLTVSSGQIEYEWEHLMKKLHARARPIHAQLRGVRRPEAHPLFRVRRGGIEPWEIT